MVVVGRCWRLKLNGVMWSELTWLVIRLAWRIDWTGTGNFRTPSSTVVTLANPVETTDNPATSTATTTATTTATAVKISDSFRSAVPLQVSGFFRILYRILFRDLSWDSLRCLVIFFERLGGGSSVKVINILRGTLGFFEIFRDSFETESSETEDRRRLSKFSEYSWIFLSSENNSEEHWKAE